MAERDLQVRFVELVQLTDKEAQVLVKIPIASHRSVNAVCERLHLHPLRIYRDSFDAGLSSYLESLRRRDQ